MLSIQTSQKQEVKKSIPVLFLIYFLDKNYNRY